MMCKYYRVLTIAVFVSSSGYTYGESDDTTIIEEVIVQGRAQQFYLEQDTSIGTKVNIDVLDLPQSAQLLNAQLMRDQAARNITDMYRSIAGVSEFSYSGVTFRGFRDSGNVFYDGVRGDPYTGFGVPQLFNVERVEVLKGPAAALYGGGEPGGMINYVTRKPSFDDETEIRLTAGNYSTAGASIDSTGGISDNLAYRLGAFYEESDSFRNNADAIDMEVAGGVLYEWSDNTRLTATFDLIRQDLGGNRLRGVPVTDNGEFLVDRSYNANEAFDYQDMEAKVGQLIFEHRFNDSLRVTTTARYLDNDRYQAYHESREWVDVNGDGQANILDGTIKREYRLQYRANKERSLTTDFVYEFMTGNLEHKFLFGGDYHDVDTRYSYLRARYAADGVANLNIFNLNYGITNPANYRFSRQNRAGGKAERYGLYLQDLVSIDQHWHLLLGLRYDHFKDTAKINDYSFDDSHITPRAGLVYKFNNESTAYLNYSESFNPAALSSQEDVEEGSLEPEQGDQVELGIKNHWLDGSMMSTLAIYRINKRNVAMNNPLDTGPGDGIPALLNIGEVESNGLEVTLVGDLSDDWTVTANYAWNDTKVVKSVEGQSLRNTFGDDGSRFVNAPKHQAGLWTRYNIGGINSAAAAGLNYVSEQFSFNDQRVKPFTTFDVSWTSKFGDTELQLNISNLFDKEYAVSGFSRRNGHFPGSPREVVLQLSHKL